MASYRGIVRRCAAAGVCRRERRRCAQFGQRAQDDYVPVLCREVRRREAAAAHRGERRRRAQIGQHVQAVRVSSYRGFVCRRVAVTGFDRKRWRIASTGCGEAFELGRHPQGIEVKAITYSALRVTESEDRTDVLVIVDV